MSPEARQRALGRIVCRLVNAPSRRKHAGPGDRGPALDRRGQRRDAGRSDRLDRGRRTHGRCRQLPARVLSRLDRRPRLSADLAGAAGARATRASCCATWPARTPRWTGSTSRSTSAPRATRSSSRRSSASWPRRATSRASAAPTAWRGRSRTPACRSPCRRSSPPASTASTRTAKQLLQVASVVGKEIGDRALGLTAGLEPEEMEPALCDTDRGRLPLRSRAVPGAGARLPPPAHPRGRLRHPARRSPGGDPRGGGAGDDRAGAGPPRRAGGTGRSPHGGRRRDARGGALVRPRRPLGRPHPAPGRAAPLAAGDGAGRRAGRDARRRRRSRCSPACCSSNTPGAWGWTATEADALAREATEIADPDRRPALARPAEAADRGSSGVADHAGEWVTAADEAIRAGGRDRRAGACGRRSAAPAPTPTCAPATSTGLEATVDEMLEMTAGDPDLGAGIVIGSPIAWGLMAKSVALRERDRPEEAEGAARRGAARSPPSRTTRRPRAGHWGRSASCSPTAATSRRRWRWRRRNCELTERLGDVFSRSTALNIAGLRAAGRGRTREGAGGRSSCPTASTARRWAPAARPRAGAAILRARALLGVGRTEEALEAGGVGGEHGATGAAWAGRSPPPSWSSPKRAPRRAPRGRRGARRGDRARRPRAATR